LDLHLHTSAEAVADVSGPDPQFAYRWLSRVVGPLRQVRPRRFAFPVARLDLLLFVRPPITVTMDAATIAVARTLYAQSMGLSPMNVTRHRQRLLGASKSWPAALSVVDAPWTTIAALVHLNIPLKIDSKARTLMGEKLSEAGEYVAHAWLAGTAVAISSAHPELVENLGLPALAYAGPAGTGRYRIPLLAAAQLLDTPEIEVSDELAAAIKRANAPSRALSTPEGFPWELYSFQSRDAARALRILETSGGVLLSGDMGSGKASPVSERVYAPSGPRAIGALNPGDTVLGSDGKPHVVTGIYPQGVRPIYKVNFTDGYSLRVTGDHLWQVHATCQKYRDKASSPHTDGKVKSTKELLENPLQDKGGNNRWHIPCILAPLEFDNPPPPLPGYILGATLGASPTDDASAPTDAEGEAGRSSMEELSSTSSSALTIHHTQAVSYSLGDQQRKQNPLTIELKRLGVWKQRGQDKYIPDAYKYAPSSVRLATLQGLLDTGGEVKNHKQLPSIEFCSTSEQLVEDVAWLTQSLGGLARKSDPPHAAYKGEKKPSHPIWRLSLSFPDTIMPFRYPRKSAMYKSHTTYRPTREIVSIEPDGKEEAVCISVDSPDQLYVAAHAILTHNTTITLAVAHQLELWPMLVVCPLAAMSTWDRQLTEMNRSHYLATERPALSWETIATGEHDAVIISYDRLHAFLEVIEGRGFAAIIADEIQRVRTPGSRRSRALRTLAQATPIRIGLSGTPLQNRIEDLLAPASFLAPGEFKPRASAKDLSDLYPGDPVEAIADHVGALMVRRRMQDTGVKLPNKTTRRLYVDLSHNQRRALEDMEAAAAAAKEEGELDRMHAFARLQRMRQIISCPSVLNVDGPSPKVQAALDLVEEFSALGRKCVVFCANRRTWTEISTGLDSLGLGHVGIWGSTPIAERLSNEKKFHEDASVRAFIGTIQSCAESLTLSPTGTVVIHCDYVYNPSDLAQAEARVYRMNQTNPVDVIYLHARAPGGTLDDRMVEILEQKRELFARVIDRTEHVDSTGAAYSLGDLVYLLTGERNTKVDTRAEIHAEVLGRDQAEKRHAKVTLHRSSKKQRNSDDFFDDGSEALLREDVLGDTGDVEDLLEELGVDIDNEDITGPGDFVDHFE
jgi:hypothetical protein